jgi:hypothetical protein
MVVAGLPSHLLLHEVAGGLEVEHEDLGFQQARVHPAPDAGAGAVEERHHDAERKQISGGQVVDRHADAYRALPGQAGDRHQSAQALHDLVHAGAFPVGAVLTETADAAVDDTGIHLAHVVP